MAMSSLSNRELKALLSVCLCITTTAVLAASVAAASGCSEELIFVSENPPAVPYIEYLLHSFFLPPFLDAISVHLLVPLLSHSHVSETTRTVLADLHGPDNPIPVHVGNWRTDNKALWCGEDPDCAYGIVHIIRSHNIYHRTQNITSLRRWSCYTHHTLPHQD